MGTSPTLLPAENQKSEAASARINRLMLSGMLWISQSGAQWRGLPEAYDPWQFVCARFAKWKDDDTLKTMFLVLSRDADMEILSIDSACIKVHESTKKVGKN